MSDHHPTITPPSPYHHSPKEGLPSPVVHHIGMTDVDVHPLAPPELHQAAETHAGVPEPPGRVQHHAHGLGALEQQLGSPGSIGAPGPVQPALQRDRAAEGVPVRRGRPASVADVAVQVIKAVPREGQPLGAGELCPAPQKRLFFLRFPAQPLPLRPRACGETRRLALRNPIPRGATQATRRAEGTGGEGGASNPLQEPRREGVG